jgi:diguanylate cyclase (GGDEF)-like protein
VIPLNGDQIVRLEHILKKVHIPAKAYPEDPFPLNISYENLGRLRFIIPLITLMELLICLSIGYDLKILSIYTGFLLFHLLLNPLVFILYHNRTRLSFQVLRVFRFIFSISSLLFAVIVSSWSLGESLYLFVTLIHILYLFSFSSERLLLLGMPYLVYLFIAYSQGVAFDKVLVITLFSCSIWVLGHLFMQLKYKGYLDTKRLRQNNRRLQKLVLKDSMTGLYNHKTIFSRLEEELSRSRRIGYPLTVMMLDIDNFKSINDTFGHLTGDEVIKSVARTLVDTARETDMIGRYGGDEFMVVMPDTDSEGAWMFSQRLKRRITGLELPMDLHITLSGGFTQFRQQPLNELIREADASLYHAKSAGKDRFIGSGPDDNRKTP